MALTSFFYQADEFVVGKVYTFAWATHGAVPTDWYRFNISIVEVGMLHILHIIPVDRYT